MNYEKCYHALCERARETWHEGYVERHHIKPRCLGGSDADSNIVYMPLRWHIHAHLLLYKWLRAEHPTLIFAVAAFWDNTNPTRRAQLNQRRMPRWVRRTKTVLGARLVREFVKANRA